MKQRVAFRDNVAAAVRCSRSRDAVFPGPEGSAMPRPLAVAVHMTREIAHSLVSRPISFGNSAYFRDGLRNLERIRQAVAGQCRLSGTWEPSARRLIHRLDRALRNPSMPFLKALNQPVAGLDPLAEFHRLIFRPLRPGILSAEDHDRVVVMIGPAIGLGDEIAFNDFLLSVRALKPRADFEVYSFFPTLWPVLTRAFAVRNLVGDPLRVFERLGNLLSRADLPRILALFANFSGHKMLAPFLRPRVGIDVLEVALGKGQAWWLPADGGPAASHREWDEVVPNQHRSLERLTAFLTVRPQGAAKGRSAARAALPPLPDLSRRMTFRLLINPLTSKDIVMSPADWAELVGVVRAALPPDHRLSCQIYPGLSTRCHDFARSVVELAREGGLLAERDSIRPLGGPDGRPFTAEVGIERTFRAISASNLLLGIDTFSAHLAAQTEVPSLAFCLWRNPRFWQRRLNTLWLDVNVGRSAVRAMTHWVVALICGAPFAGRDPRPAAGIYRRIVSLEAAGGELCAPSGRRSRRFRGWLSLLDATWQGLPAAQRNLLARVDEDFAWPRVRASLVAPNATSLDLRRAFDRLTDSMFLRLIALCARRAQTDSRATATGKLPFLPRSSHGSARGSADLPRSAEGPR